MQSREMPSGYDSEIAATIQARRAELLKYRLSNRQLLENIRKNPALRELATNLQKHILHEDADLLVINKPPGVLAKANETNPCGVQEVLLFAKRSKDILAAHRLDKDTTGVLVFTKHDDALAKLLSQFRNKSNAGMDKLYLALMEGQFATEAPQEVRLLLTGLRERRVRVADPTVDDVTVAKEALSYFSPVTLFANKTDSSKQITLASVQIVTGRKHQIRVSAEHLGMPIVGDRLYNSSRSDVPRQMLHALRLELRHPRTDTPVTFVAPPPDDFNSVTRGLTVIKNYERSW